MLWLHSTAPPEWEASARHQGDSQRKIHVLCGLVAMETGSILIAETDPAVRRALPRILASHLPRADIKVCTSFLETIQSLSHSNYSTVVAAPHLIHKEHSLLLHRTEHRHVLSPVIITATKTDIEPAHNLLLHRGAFDVIAKPVDDAEVLSSVRVALWQARFLRLLAQQEPVLSNIRRHIEAYPEERDIRGAIGKVLQRINGTVTLVQESIKLIDPSAEGLFYDLAVSVGECIKEKAMARLNQLSAYAR